MIMSSVISQKVDVGTSRLVVGCAIPRTSRVLVHASIGILPLLLILLLLQSVLQPLVGFGLLYDFVPQSSIFTLLSPVSHFHLL